MLSAVYPIWLHRGQPDRRALRIQNMFTATPNTVTFRAAASGPSSKHICTLIVEQGSDGQLQVSQINSAGAVVLRERRERIFRNTVATRRSF